MNGPELQSEARRWLRFAQEDLREAERLLASPDSVPRHAAGLHSRPRRNPSRRRRGRTATTSAPWRERFRSGRALRTKRRTATCEQFSVVRDDEEDSLRVHREHLPEPDGGGLAQAPR
jgi:hypothetical protein